MLKREFLFTLIASNAGISPKVISFVPDNGNYLVDIEMYPSTLSDQPDWCSYQQKMDDLLQRLHDLGNLHNDVTEENIVVNPDTGDVRLIDFGLSLWIDELSIGYTELERYGIALTDDEVLHGVHDMHRRRLTMQDPSEDQFDSIGEVLEWERDEITRLCRWNS